METKLKYEDFAVGQRWRRGRTEVETIHAIKAGEVYPIRCESGASFDANGKYVSGMKSPEHDLIELLPPEPEPSPVAKTSRAVRDAMLIDEPKMECWRIYDEVSFGGIAIGGPVGKQYVESIEVDPYNKTATLKLDNGELEQVFNINRASYRPVKAEAKETAGEK